VTLGADGRGRLAASPALQSWPGIVHGGGLVALIDEAAARVGGTGGPRVVEGRLTASVPVNATLALEAGPYKDEIVVTVRQNGQPLASGIVGPAPGAAPGLEGKLAALTPRLPGWALPTSDHCLACGALNPVGLRATLHLDEDRVWTRIEPSAAWARPGGGLHPALVPVLLDEIAWWLGAATMHEGGLTNRLAVTFHRSGIPAGPVIASGRLADVKPVDRQRLFWRTQSTLATADGEVLAAASIVFRGGPDYSAHQIPYFAARTAPDLLQRLFPRHPRAR